MFGFRTLSRMIGNKKFLLEKEKEKR